MKLFKVNLESAMLKANAASIAKDKAVLHKQASMDSEVAKLIKASKEEASKMDAEDCMRLLGMNYKLERAREIKAETDRWSHLQQDRIFAEEAIRDVCLAYGLRFLQSSLYKGALDEGIAPAIEAFKTLNGGLPGNPYIGYSERFFIAAPKESFHLTRRPKDPLLFYSLGFGKYYLIHKWGSDLSIFRRLRIMLTWLLGPALFALGVPCFIRAIAFNTPDGDGFLLFLGSIPMMIFGAVILWRKIQSRSEWNSKFSD